MRRTFALIIALVATGSPPAAAAAADLDATFSGNGIATAFNAGSVATAVALDQLGRIVVAGYTASAGPDIAVARLMPDGSFDPDFSEDGRVRLDLGGSEYAFDLVLDAEGGLAIAGRSGDGTDERFLVVRMDPSGSPDASFSVDGVMTVDFGKPYQSANAIAFTPQGRLVLGGYVSNGISSNAAVARLLPSGQRDTSFSGNGRVTIDTSDGAEQINDLLVTGAGRIIASGSTEAGLQPRFLAMKLRSDGRLDRDFSGNGIATADVSEGADLANALTSQANGKIVLAGRAANGGTTDWGLVRFDGAGVLDPSFHGDGIRIVPFAGTADEALGVLALGGGLWVAGRGGPGGGDLTLARVTTSGALDAAFSGDGLVRVDPFGGADAARGLAVQTDGKMVLAGEARDGLIPRFVVTRILTAPP